MKVKKVISLMEQLAPPGLAAEWDNVGLQMGDPEREICRVLVALDVDFRVVEEASRAGPAMLVVHHPLLFKPVSSLSAARPLGKMVEGLARSGTSVYVAHTNLDASQGGTADVLAETAGLVGVSPLELAPGFPGGRLGSLPGPISARSFGNALREQLLEAVENAWLNWYGASEGRWRDADRIPSFTLVGPSDREIRTVAVVPGSGADALDVAKQAGADMLVTGDVRHHAAVNAELIGLSVLDIGHYLGEVVALLKLVDRLHERLARSWSVVERNSAGAPPVFPCVSLFRQPFVALSGQSGKESFDVERSDREIYIMAGLEDRSSPPRKENRVPPAPPGSPGMLVPPTSPAVPAASTVYVGPGDSAPPGRNAEDRRGPSQSSCHRKLVVYADGASAGNPGPAGIGVIVTTPSGALLLQMGRPIGVATNNAAEYTALIAGLEEALKLGARDVDVAMDSELVVRQIQGSYRVRNEGLQKLHAKAVDLLARFRKWSIRHVDREHNRRADELASSSISPAPQPRASD